MANPVKYMATDGSLFLTLEVAEEGGFIVTAPFDPDVFTQADSLEEAFEMARDLIALLEEERAETRAPKAAKKPARRRTKQKAG